MSLPRRLLAHVRDAGLLPPGTRVLVALSGGADSVALLRLLVAVRRGLRLGEVTAAHLDHGLRAGSSDDAQFAASVAADLGVRCVVRRVRVRRRKGESPEEAARRVRYRFLADAARELGADLVATAHHLDDQAETVLLRVLRGAGLAGLRGILPRAVVEGADVVRPLLPFRRDELRAWLRRQGGPWVEDPTNADGNDRALVRNEILPLVRRALGRDPAGPLAALADAARAEFVAPVRPASAPAASPGNGRTPSPCRPVGVTWETRPLDGAAVAARLAALAGQVELLDADRVRGPLRVRAPVPGDRFDAAGLPRPQRLGHYLQRRGVPAGLRAAWPLLCDDEGIVLVAGHGLAERVRVGDATSRVVVTRLVEAK